MSLMSDRQIARACNFNYTQDGFKPSSELVPKGALVKQSAPMITPFVPMQVRAITTHRVTEPSSIRKIVSFGLSSYGYDVRLGDKFKMFALVNQDGYGLQHVPLDPLDTQERDYIDVKPDAEGAVTIPPGGILLGHTLEYFNMPNDVLAVCMGKSTYARLGINVLVTPLEPGWCGSLVVEMHNGNTRPVKVYAGMGIAQLVFMRGEPPTVTYADRDGKYQAQTGVTLAKC